MNSSEPPGPFSTGHMADSPFEGGSSFDPAETVVALGAPSSSSNSSSQPMPGGAVTNVPQGQGSVNPNVMGTMSPPPKKQGYPNQNVPGAMNRPPQGQSYPNQNVPGAMNRLPQGQGYPNQNLPSGAVTNVPQSHGYPHQNMPGVDPRFANAGMQGGQWNGPSNYNQPAPMPQQGQYGQPAFNGGPAPSWQAPQGGSPSAQGYGQPPAQGFGGSGPFSNPGAAAPSSGAGSNAAGAAQPSSSSRAHSSRKADGSRSSKRNAANEEVGKGIWLLVGGMVFLFIVISIILYNHFMAPAPVMEPIPETTQNVYVPPTGDTGFLDPVSGEPVDPATTPYFVDYGGATFYFTSDDHRSRFMAAPLKYVTPQYKANPNAPPVNMPQGGDGNANAVPEPEGMPDTPADVSEPDGSDSMNNGYTAPETDVPADTSGSAESAPSYNDVPPPDDSGTYEEEEVVPPSGDADFAPPGSGSAGGQVPADGQGAGGSSEDTPGWVP